MTRVETTSGTMGEQLLVWVDAWQMQCWGDPFAVDSRVAWTLHMEPDRGWLTAVLGDDLARHVTHAEEHHGGLPDDAPVTAGVVARIRAVSSRSGPDPTDAGASPVHVPIPGTASVVDVSDADGWYPETDDLDFNG
ncbi:DUF6578 domain-containing protein [Salana multivorans]